MQQKLFKATLAATLAAALLTGCASEQHFDPGQEIVVISREDGSGTRAAFVELAGVLNADKQDQTTKEAEVVNQTSVVLTSVEGNQAAIGYISMGSLGQTVKALKIDGVAATAENVKNGSYTLARPFNIAYQGEPEGLKKDFIDFIFSRQGQAVIESMGVIAMREETQEYQPSGQSGKLTIAGSSSVTPVMEKLVEAYVALNPDASLELQQSDSSAGMKAVIDGTADIGMASRQLKDSEKAELQHTAIAMDGIAVIVNLKNSIDNLTKAQVAGIYKGEITFWSDVT